MRVYSMRLSRDWRALVDGIHNDAASLEGGPLPALVVDGRHIHDCQDENPLCAHELALIVLWLRSPCQERGDILSHKKKASIHPVAQSVVCLVKYCGQSNADC